MSLFDIFKPKKKKEEDLQDMTELEKDVEKAKEDIKEKGADSQSKQDRIDESVAADLREEGKEDTQTAKDRIDESEGEEKHEHRREFEERFAALEGKLDKLLSLMEEKAKIAEKVSDNKLESAREKYGLSTQPFVEEKEEFSDDDVEKILKLAK